MEEGMPVQYVYDRKALARIDRDHLQEWYLADGAGGYAAGSITNGLFRKHQGYLVTSLNPPTDRTVFLAKTEEAVESGGVRYDFAAQKYRNGETRGDRHLVRFILDETASYRYEAGGASVEKTIAPKRGGGAVAIRYRIAAGDRDVRFVVTPLFTFRNHGDVRAEDELAFDVTHEDGVLVLVPAADRSQRIVSAATAGRFVANDERFVRDVWFDFDAATGDDRTDVLFQPCRLEAVVPAGTAAELSLVVSAATGEQPTADTIIDAYRAHARDVVAAAGLPDDFSRRLARAADQFIAFRRSTGLATVLAGFPWFADWGRDTMIAFEGLVLVTKRFAEAREILSSFARYEKDGLIPNMFPDAGREPLYNTADASLWYIHAVERYLDRTGDETFVAGLYPTLARIVAAYERGTAFSIGMDYDTLMRAGSGLDQVTWMDVRIDGVVVTPRHGKPVEINALWHEALSVMAALARRFGKDPEHYEILAARVRDHFLKRFWNPERGLLFDVVDPDDPSVRPNMLFAASLPHTMLSREMIRRIVRRATLELLDVYGLRSLSKDDPRFVPVYSGPLRKRDFAYHMGTTWGYLIGTYVDSYLKAYPSEAAKKRMKQLCLSFEKHLTEGCIGGVAEIFDGLGGTVSRGCSSQAWSVAELLRTYVDNGLGRT